ncbi:glycosyltransferase family 2 protein [Marinibactrum halimedae]|uniref:Glycosyltransferase 2-like domain-containing protein n=1 Tax=Marinibactrum halimedae TaxID=1444977 RepID=A0AA37T496_9GAMM|nr:glycosyltransferase [Marinibactrum halimedae]MCD9457833.1 glycosyltransferase [Marinibactrum halimedae]GLS24793.1 hypothetical protein GCM10007877_05070 [Marinibactrum halimedae]
MKKNQIAFSVVIPLYNKTHYILEALDSVLNQSYPALEVVVIDDGSTDDGVEKISKLNNENIKVFSQKNQGVSAARNMGVEKSIGEYVAFLDADDKWSPHYLAEVEKLIRLFPDAGVYGSNYQCFNKNGLYLPKIRKMDKEVGPYVLPNYFEVCSEGELPFIISSCVIPKKVHEKVGGFPVGESMGEDQDFFFRIALTHQIAYSNRITVFYRSDADNSAMNISIPDQECFYSQRLTRFAHHSFVRAQDKKWLLKCSAAHLIHLASRNIRVGRFDIARRLLMDERCSLKSFKRRYWLANLYVRKLFSFLNYC